MIKAYWVDLFNYKEHKKIKHLNAVIMVIVQRQKQVEGEKKS